MKIAAAYQDGAIFEHFGRSEQFKVYDVENGKIIESQIVKNNGEIRGGALAKFLANEGVKVLICSGLGSSAQSALSESGIQFFGGVTGMADDAVNAYLAGNLKFEANPQCANQREHGHKKDHACGGHHNGEKKHGCGGHHCHKQ